MSAPDLEIAPMGEADLAPLAAFMRAHGQAGMDEQRLRHWYLHNPAGSSTVMLGRLDGRIVGMATTNDHWFNGPGGRVLVGMPQKVLTDHALRGRGIFGRLYQASEEAGRRNGLGFFLTVTNAASTPIFLGRFGYRRLPSPRMLVFSPSLRAVRDEVPLAAWPAPLPTTDEHAAWRMEKGEAHGRWRFLALPGEGHEQHAFRSAGGGGLIVLKRMTRKGVPVMLLLDLVPDDPSSAHRLLQQARRIARRRGCVALLALVEPRIVRAAAGIPRVTVPSGFNLLVKGMDDAHTARLLGDRFELAFGDLDFL